MATKKTAPKKSTKKTTARKPAAKPERKAKPPQRKPAATKASDKGSRPKADPKPKRVNALDAAATVLAKSAEPLNSKQLIEAMAAQQLWTSPGGKTPSATLHAAISKEIAGKGAESRFTKAGRGLFAANG